MSIESDIQNLVNQMTSQRTLNKWRHLCKININKFVKHAAKTYFTLKANKYYFYIDTSTLTDGFIIQGVKPNIAAVNTMKGFGIRTRQLVNLDKPIHVKINDDVGWKTIKHRLRGYHDLRAKPLKTSYYGVSGEPVEYFGAKKRKGKGKAKVYGVIEHESVPIYSAEGVADWLMTNREEMYRILQECAISALQSED